MCGGRVPEGLLVCSLLWASTPRLVCSRACEIPMLFASNAAANDVSLSALSLKAIS